MAEMLATQGLLKRFGGLTVTDHVALSVHDKEIHALIGPNGAGKSTLVNLLAGSIRPDAGSIRMAGKDVCRLRPHERCRQGLSRSFQLTSIFREFTVRDNLLLAVSASAPAAIDPWFGFRSDSVRNDRAAELADRVGISSLLDQTAGTLSHGLQRALDVALALASAPKVLLLDEPLAGMGPEDSERMIVLLGALRSDVAMLLVEHDMDAVFKLADRISVLHSGRIVSSGSPAEIRRDRTVQSIYLGQEGQAP